MSCVRSTSLMLMFTSAPGFGFLNSMSGDVPSGIGVTAPDGGAAAGVGDTAGLPPEPGIGVAELGEPVPGAPALGGLVGVGLPVAVTPPIPVMPAEGVRSGRSRLLGCAAALEARTNVEASAANATRERLGRVEGGGVIDV